MSELSSIKSQALTERIEERLFAYILDNHLKVGAKLPNEHELAAQNRTDEEVEQLAEYCDAVREKIEAGEDYLIEDMRFHWFLAKCSHNMVVEPLMPIIDAAVISIANITRKELLTMTIDTHKEILDAVRDRDPQAARSAMSVHLDMNRIFIRQTKTAR